MRSSSLISRTQPRRTGAALLAAALWTSSPSVPAQDITWSIPEDGGTPRDAGRIERMSPAEFRIRASFEDGTVSILRHAVSRVDLVCRNAGTQPAKVTVHLDLSDDGKRTDYDTRPESGMKLRDFLFIQPPGGDWRQVNGTTEKWVATVQFEAMPGETRVGLSPWYTYSDLLRFVNRLPEHPHLTKRVAGKSDGGREQWELTITDPAVADAEKRTVFWQAREHAYETWSSFAMEGLGEFLLSDAAADFRKRYTIVLHPMTNVDGVAQGFEYRGSYDLPGPRLKASGRVTLEAIDRLKPQFAVAWHNWVAPRDRNVVFYTDGENGRATPRAWLRFTQLFPSLRASDHRWKDETTPLKYNWQGRSPLSEDNVHQYAMKKYGTGVWGWEMPWWNCTVPEVRASGGAFVKAFLTTLTEIQAGTVPAATEEPEVTVPSREMHEFTAWGRSSVNNPFRDAALVGEFTAPSGKVRVVDGFHDGDDTWRLRFAPDEEGDWTYLLRGEGVEILRRGKLRCTAAKGPGMIRLHPDNPYVFARADGTTVFPMGDTCYGLFDDSPVTPELRAAYLKTRRTQRFNFVRMSVGHSEARAKAGPAWWAWGGTFEKPDLDRFNPVFFRAFDALMHQLREAGMNAELILLNFYRRPFTDTALWTPARERQWLRYLIARYGAFDNLFLWTLANEYETHPDGNYRLDFPADVEWAKATANWIKANDAHGHLVTVHPVISASRSGTSPRAPFDPPWRIGEFFGDCPGIDVLSQQTGQHGEGTVWDDRLQCWTGDSVTLTASVQADRKYRKPVLNSENGYEYLRGDPTSKKQVHHTDKVRRSSWRIVCSGGYVAAGFHGTIGHSDAWNRLDPNNHYSFQLRDEGAGAQLGVLYDFMSALPLARMQPFSGIKGDGVALAEAGRIYVACLPHGGAVRLDLGPAGGAFTSRWFNPRTGETGAEFATSGGPDCGFTAPDGGDWVLLVKAAAGK